jgi:DNA-binding NarL/FixJ family response regulator
VLLDVQLPDMNGFEVASKVTANGSGAKIVLVSSRDGSDFGPLVYESGARGFIPKGELSGARLSALIG